jgi:tetratricopeptide (TPR) repeat protein
MKVEREVRLALLAALLLASSARAQEPPVPGPAAPSAAAFPTGCNPAVQAAFDRSVALLMAFEDVRAREAFGVVAQRDPSCGMAYWGIAMSCYRPQSEPPRPEALAAGRDAAEKAAAIGAPSDRERRYVAAVRDFYQDAASLDEPGRAAAYRNEMAGLYAALPDDDHAAIFYALALFETAPPTDATYAQKRQAAEILNRRMPAVSRYLHVVHYMIHALDEPGLAELALPAAREFAARGPRLAHPLHMPSHIFTRLGMWQESIAANLASEAAANRFSRGGAGTLSADTLHALDYLEYAYLQTCRENESLAIAERALAAEAIDSPIYTAGYALAAIPARRALERSNWQEAAGLPLPRPHLPWERFPYALALTHFARALGAAQEGDIEKARTALGELARIQSALEQAPPGGDPYDWTGAVESMRQAAEGVLAQGQGRGEEALKLLRAAAELEETTGKHAVTPGAVLPAREILADVLCGAKRPAEALVEYEAVLATAPGRLRALAGAARSALAVGETEKARGFARQILAQCDPAGDWPEVAMARALLAAEAPAGTSP